MTFPNVFDALCASTIATVIFLAAFRAKQTTGWAWAALVIGAGIAGCIANIDRFESLTVSLTGGIAAKTRELQTTIDKANATVASLDRLAVILGKLQVNMLAAQGRVGPSAEYQDEQKGALIAQLKALGLSDPELSDVAR
jgi:hypothetical protein